MTTENNKKEIEGEIKSKEGVLEDFVGVLPVKLSQSQYAQIYRAMEAYASQFTASKEKEYREALERIIFLPNSISMSYEMKQIATEALNK